VSTAAPARLTRSRLRSALQEAVAAGVLTLDEAEDLLTAYDTGDLDYRALPPEALAALGSDPDSDALAAFALAALAAFALAIPAATSPVRWRYRAATGTYETPGGRPLHPLWVRRELDRALDRAAVPLAGEALRRDERTAGRREWMARVEGDLLRRHAAAAALARGGIGQMTDEDRDWLRARVLDEYRYLDGFDEEMARLAAAGTPMSEAQVAARLAMYNDAARATYEAMRGRVAVEGGATEARSVLAVADHCRAGAGRAGCVEEARRGWVPAETVVAVGRRRCLSRCRCRIEYRAGAA
jgi:hypothetical protein